MSSRLYRHRQKANNRKIIFFFIVFVVLGIFMFKTGFKLLINSAIFIHDFVNSNSEETMAVTDDDEFYGSIDLDIPQTATNSATIIVSGDTTQFDTVELYINNTKVETANVSENNSFSEEIGSLKEGENRVYALAKTKDNKHQKQSDEHTVLYKKDDLTLEIESPEDGQTVHTQEITVRGKTDPGTTVHVNNQPVVVDFEGNFSASVRLQEGDNRLKVEARDIAGNLEEAEIKVRYEKDD